MKEIIPRESLVFKGVLNNALQLKAYMTFVEQYCMLKDVKKPRFTLRLYSKRDDILLILNKKYNSAYLRYASGLNSLGRRKWQDRIKENRDITWKRIEAIVESEQTSIEGYAALPKIPRLNLMPLGNFNYQDLCLGITKEIDEKRKELAEDKETQDTGPKPPERKFLGKAMTLDESLGYFDLARFAYQRYDFFVMVFSAERKPSLNLVLKNSNTVNRKGHYYVTSAFFDENFTEKDMISREDLERGPDTYVLERLKARFSQLSSVKIEGYSNPPIADRVIKFSSPILIDNFLLDLGKKLPNNQTESQAAVNLGAEDKDTQVIQKKPEISSNPIFSPDDNIEQKLDDIFGENK